MPWTLTSFLANKKIPTQAASSRGLLDWQAEETERLASGQERAQLKCDPNKDRRA